MRTHHLSALVALALSAALLTGAGCLATAPEADDTASPSIARESPRAGEPEPTGVAQQPMGHIPLSYGSKDFPFVVQLKDDRTDVGGGWQISVTTLKFAVAHGIEPVYAWTCPIAIEVPIRSAALGRITASRASLWTADAANSVVESLFESRKDPDDWIGHGATFCIELNKGMRKTLNNMHQGLGARVYRP